MQVDLTFSGHTHLYERSRPVLQKTAVSPAEDGSARAPMHVILGNAGQVRRSWPGLSDPGQLWRTSALQSSS